MSCLIWPRARGTTTHIQVKNFVLADFLTFIALLNSSILYILPVSTALSAVLYELSPVVHRGLGAAGQLVTLIYRGKINDLTLWVWGILKKR